MLAGPGAWKSRLLVFDVNETLLDLNALAPHFQRIFGAKEALKQWFAQTLLYSQCLTLIEKYANFAEIALRSLEMTACAYSVQMTEDDATAIGSAMRMLPPHRDVPEALVRLRKAGFRLVALTNSAQAVVDGQMQSAKLDTAFERIISVDLIRKYKPHPDVYRYVAREFKVETSDLLMIAAHPWDLMGANAAGCGVAFVERSGTAWNNLLPKPQLFGRDLGEVATKVISLAGDCE